MPKQQYYSNSLKQAKHLEDMDHCFTATPDTLLEVMQTYNPAKLIPYTPGDARGIVSAIEGHMQSMC